MPDFPRLPRISEFLRKKNPLHGVIDEAKELINTGREEIGNIASALRIEGEPPSAPPAELSPAPETEHVSEEATLSYQFDLLQDDLQHLEEHLAAKGRIGGRACDCIQKAARSVRRHALETIPIAARQGKDAKLFAEIAEVGNHLVQIGTLDAVNSGKYDEEYLKYAGAVSSFRKQVELGCEPCDRMGSLHEYIERRKHKEE